MTRPIEKVLEVSQTPKLALLNSSLKIKNIVDRFESHGYLQMYKFPR